MNKPKKTGLCPAYLHSAIAISFDEEGSITNKQKKMMKTKERKTTIQVMGTREVHGDSFLVMSQFLSGQLAVWYSTASSSL